MRGNQLAGAIRSHRVIEVLSKLITHRSAPRYLRSDNGPEFVSQASLQWTVDQEIEAALIDPGKPWQTGTTKSINGKWRDESSTLDWFCSRIAARIVIENWRKNYNKPPLTTVLDIKPTESVQR
jgi:putative transposase